MGAKFVRNGVSFAWYDHCIINGRKFDVQIGQEEGKRSLSIQGGRITFFLMTEDDINNEPIAVSCYDNGKWEIKCPEEDDEACIAQNYFIARWNRSCDKPRIMEVPSTYNRKKGNENV